ncbi:MAG TPA: DUF1919 domain-containing protein [Methylomirabilota bacterium]|nr:DUF1919 domain-containing protein [Methylomirabilota bacterium]
MAAITLPTPGTAPRPHVWEPLKVWRRRVAARWMRARVTNRDFTIISNDCFGGMAYEELGMRYDSPFVGMFLVPEDYMQLLRGLRRYCEEPIQFKAASRHSAINEWREVIRKQYPIGVLGGEVEIHFLHYAARDEAEAKWTRRAQRIHWDNLLVKICWHDDARMESWLGEFDGMPFSRKLGLVPHELPGLRSSVALRGYTTDGTAQYWIAHRHFDVAAWLNRGVIHRGSCGRLLDWLLYWHY